VKQTNSLLLKYKLWLLSVITVVCHFSVAQAGSKVCASLFMTDNISATVIADKVYNALTKDDSFLAKLYPNYFKKRIEFTHDILFPFTPEQVEYIRFAQDKLNDAKSFRVYIEKLLLESSKNSTPTREEILKVIMHRLAERDFLVKESIILDVDKFYEGMKVGIIVLETDEALLREGHGHDTHLMQIDYLAQEFDKKFGKGKILEFYKFMGKDKFIWQIMFDDVENKIIDDPYTYNLGNPIMLTRRVFPYINLR
jgi:hypothetical protein